MSKILLDALPCISLPTMGEIRSACRFCWSKEPIFCSRMVMGPRRFKLLLLAKIGNFLLPPQYTAIFKRAIFLVIRPLKRQFSTDHCRNSGFFLTMLLKNIFFLQLHTAVLEWSLFFVTFLRQ